MADDKRGEGIELADSPEVKEAAALALDAVNDCYECPDGIHLIGNDAAEHIIALAIAAGQFKANERAEKAENELRVANLKLMMLTLAMDESDSVEDVRDLRDGEQP